VECSRELQARAAEELALLLDGSAVVEMMGDYALMWDQARGCNLGAKTGLGLLYQHERTDVLRVDRMNKALCQSTCLNAVI
jgi:hypothetical protein